MTTTKKKALLRALKGAPSKLSPSKTQQEPAGIEASQANAPVADIRKRNSIQGAQAEPQVSKQGKSSRGRSATLNERVSHASQRTKDKKGPDSKSPPAVARKRANSKTKNIRGKNSIPDLKAIDDEQTQARAAGRRNKATATTEALKKT
jgi:hypothetical protein